MKWVQVSVEEGERPQPESENASFNVSLDMYMCVLSRREHKKEDILQVGTY